MKLLRSVNEVQRWRASIAEPVGFIPTMGALHEGHGSLVRTAQERGDQTLVSIFVNPTQFNNPADLALYPRVEAQDLEQCQQWNVDAVFLPSVKDIYSDGFRYEVREKELSALLCGAHRPGHFDGVLTVVLKLLQMTQPTRAYFGEKDYQQLKLVEGMARAFFLPVEIVACPIVREADGLAMSSRNRRLAPSERERAACIPRVLRESPDAESARHEFERIGFQVDYVSEHWGRRFAAVFCGEVRLIDNVEL